MKELRLAVLGTGYWSTFQIPAWFECEGVRVVALYNRTVSRAEQIATQYNIPHVYGDPEEAFKNEKLDFVDIIAHEVMHAPLVSLAAQYRVPAICQKPMGPDFDTCATMVQVCREAGVPLMVHENFRWQRPMRAIKLALDARRIGEPYRAHIRLGHGIFELVQKQPYLKQLQHWALTDMGSHGLDLARFFFGEAQSLYCQTHRTHKWQGAVGEDIASVILRMGKVICTCELGWEGDPPVFVEGTEGTLALGTDDVLTITTEQGSTSQRILYPWYSWADSAYGACHPSIVDCNADLVRAVRTGEQAETNGDDNLRTMRLVYASYESAERNEVVHLD